MAITVTATNSDGSAGIYLQVEVITGVKETGGASASATGSSSGSASLTPAGSGSFIAWSFEGANSGDSAPAAAANNSLLTVASHGDSATDTNGFALAHGYYSGTVTSGTPVTAGAANPAVAGSGELAAYELPLAGPLTWVEDTSTPAWVHSSAAATITTASFTPPAGAVLVAVVQWNFAGSGNPSTTMTVSGGGLTWTARKYNSTSAGANGGVGIFTATVPGLSWSVLQSAGNNAHIPAGNALSATLSSNLTAGSKLLAWVSWDNGNSAVLTSVKDTAGNTFTLVPGTLQNYNSGFGGGGLYYLDTPAGDVGSSTTITASFTTTIDCAMLVQEVSGLLTGSAGTDGSAGDLTGSTTGSAQGPPTYSSTAAGEYLAYALLDNGGTTGFAGPSGYNADTNNQQSVNSSVNVYCKPSTGGTEGGTFTPGSGSLGWNMIMVAFQLAPLHPPLPGNPIQSAIPGIPEPWGFVPGLIVATAHGTTHNLSLAALIAMGAALGPETVSKHLGSLVAMGALTQRSISRNVISAAAATGTVKRSLARPLTGASVTTFAATRNSVGRLLAAVMVVYAVVTAVRHRLAALVAQVVANPGTARSIGKLVDGTVAATASPLRSIGHACSTGMVTAGSLLRSAGKSLTAPVVAAASMTTTKVKLLALAAQVVTAVAVRNQVGRLLAAQVVAISTVQRTANRALSAIAVTISSMSTIKAKLVALAAQVATIARQNVQVGFHLSGVISATDGVLRSCGKLIAGGAVATGTLARSVGKGIPGFVATFASTAFTKVKLVILSAQMVITNAITRRISTQNTANAILNAGITRSIARPIQGTIVIAGQTARAIGKKLSAITTATASAFVQRVRIIALSAAMSVSGAVRRSIGFKPVATAAISAGFSKVIRFALRAFALIPPQLIQGRAFLLSLVTGIATASSIATQAIRLSFLTIFKAGDAAVNWVAGQIKKNWRVP